jgi:hypothetical protein
MKLLIVPVLLLAGCSVTVPETYPDVIGNYMCFQNKEAYIIRNARLAPDGMLKMIVERDPSGDTFCSGSDNTNDKISTGAAS